MTGQRLLFRCSNNISLVFGLKTVARRATQPLVVQLIGINHIWLGSLIQSKRLVGPKRSWSAVQQFEYTRMLSGYRDSASNEICYCWGWGAPRLGGGGRKNGTEKGRASWNSCFFSLLPLVVLSVRVAASDEFSKGHLFQSCQPSVFLELSGKSVRLLFLETEFQKALKKQAVLYFQTKMH